MDLLDLALKVLSGVCWTIVYVQAIRVGLRARSYAIPFVALAMNLVWEWLYAIGGVLQWEQYGVKIHVQTVVNIVWAALDVIILLLFLRVMRARSAPIRSSALYWGVASAIVLSGIYQAGFLMQFGAELGAKYSAFLQNAAMSMLFIAMLYRRGSPEGQSVTIAVAKLLGTLAPTITAGIIGGVDWLILAAGTMCLIGDSFYLWALRITQASGHVPGLVYVSGDRHGIEA